MTACVYGLCDPVTFELRYVGRTTQSIFERAAQHGRQARRGGRSHLHCWLRALPRRPHAVVLEVVATDELMAAESAWIVGLRARGFRLVNANDGGRGPVNPTPESRRRMAAAQRGRKRPPEVVAKISAALSRRQITPETRAKLSASATGRRHTEATRAKLRIARGRRPPASAATRAKMSAAQKGRRVHA